MPHPILRRIPGARRVKNAARQVLHVGTTLRRSVGEATSIPWPPENRHPSRLDTNTVALIPVYLGQRNFLEMLRIQSLLPQRLGIPCLFVFDYVPPEYRKPVLALNLPWTLYLTGKPTGIRRPTEAGLREIRARCGHDAFVLRVIQDVFISNPAAVSEQIANTRYTPGDWIAGAIKTFYRYPANPNFQALAALQIPEQPEYRHVHGEFSFAPLRVWETYYLPLHKSITHYADDDVMSQWILKNGGQLLNWKPAWEHQHNIPTRQCRAIYQSHLATLTPSPTPSTPSFAGERSRA